MDDPVPVTADEQKRSVLAEKLAHAETIVAMIKTLTLPLLILFLVICFYRPLSQIVSLLPAKLRDADKLSAGGLTFEIHRSAVAAGNPRLAKIIAGLSEPALRELLTTSPNSSRHLIGWGDAGDGTKIYYLPDPDMMAAIEQLESASFVDCSMPLPSWKDALLKFGKPVDPAEPTHFYFKNGIGQRDADAVLTESCQLSKSGNAALELILSAMARELARGQSLDNSEGDGNE